MIELKYQVTIKSLTADNVADLRVLFNSLKFGHCQVADVFPTDKKEFTTEDIPFDGLEHSRNSLKESLISTDVDTAEEAL